MENKRNTEVVIFIMQLLQQRKEINRIMCLPVMKYFVGGHTGCDRTLVIETGCV